MRNLVKRLYSIQALFAFVVPFILIFPLFFIFLQRKEWYKYAFEINHWWSKAFFFLSGISFEIEYRQILDADRRYIFCPNHFSYLDIASMVRNKYLFAFMGKDEMQRIPFFGYMYKRMHITVDRGKMKSRYGAILRAGEVLDSGRSITIFPEGGIISKDPPNLVNFKDGAFRLAIEKQVAIVPVTIPYNWIILPDDEKFLIDKSKKMKMIFHEPIETIGMTMNDIRKLKEQTFSIIEKELRIMNT